MATEVIEKGALYFFYRPKVDVPKVRGINDVQRFYFVMAPDDRELYRLIIIGQKYMPEIFEGKMAREELNWAIVDLVTSNSKELGQEKLGWEETSAEKTVFPARPVGVAQYQLIQHGRHTELAYQLEVPEKPGQVQDAFNIFEQGSYIFKIKNPSGAAPGYPGAKQKAGYPKELEEFFDSDWIDAKDKRILDYENTQLLLMGARKHDIEKELDITFHPTESDKEVNDLYRIFALKEEDHPKKPLTQGQWPDKKEAA